jgi:CHAT domain-containing protein
MTAFAQWREVHRGLVRVLLAQDRPREAFLALDRSRARHLQDLRTQSRVSNQLPSIKRARLDSLTRALLEVRNRLGTTGLTAAATTRLRNREARLMAARQQLLSLDSTSTRMSLKTLSETLAQKNRALVSYYLDDPWPVFDRSPRSVAFVVTGDSLRAVSLDGLTQDDVEGHVEAVSPLFSSSGKPHGANEMHFDLRPLHRLHDAVYAPVAKHLPGRRPLTVIPDGPLFHLPFSMLVHSMPKGRFAPSAARFVLHDRATSHELAASLVADTAQASERGLKREPRMVAYGVSSFDTLRTVPSALRTVLPEATADSMLALPPLPGVRQELRALQSTVEGARVVLDGEATEANFRHSVQTAGVLHVASHAFVNPTSPLRNAILLHPDSSSQNPSDGILFLHELHGRQARLPMVVLSGCNTASGTLRGGEGMEGLQYAFRAMGAQSTVSTLWPVSDEASVELMDAFYRSLQDGHPKDVALRRAQLSYLEAHPDKASPFFWAPPVLYGSPGSLPLKGPLVPGWAWWGLLGLGLLALGGGAVYLGRSESVFAGGIRFR